MNDEFVFWLFVLLAAVCLPSACRADTWITGSGLSYHLHREKSHNELNLGAGVEHGSETLRFTAGYYRNSEYRDSYYLGAMWLPVRLGDVRLGAVAGGVTGYTSGMYPLLLPAATFERGDFGVNLTVVPGRVVGMQFKWRWR